MRGLPLTDAQVVRYSRHILLPEIDVAGQRRLLGSSVLVVGAGGLGSAALLYLAAAGVGRIAVADGDVVEVSNLQRQVIHRAADVGRPKADSAAAAIRALNPDCEVEVFGERLSAGNIRDVVRGRDLVLDGSDNFPTRFLAADCCWFEKVPLVSAAVIRFEGQLLAVLPGKGNPCYRCLVPDVPPASVAGGCREVGVAGPAVGVMGTLQAVEALKVLLGKGRDMARRLLVYDALEGRFRTIARSADPDCPLCGPRPTITELVEYRVDCCGPDEMRRGCCT